MLDIQDWLRYAFQTSNNYTIALSASGHGGMEASMLNFVEPGDVVLVGTNGIWGERAADIARRAGGVVRELSAAPGTVYTLAALEAAFAANPGAKLLFLTHGESSTGTLQPVGGIGALAHAHGALFVLDTVCTLAGVPVAVDEDEIDVVYSGSQKALGAPPGVAPLTLSPRALARFALRAAPPASYYFDAGLLGRSWAVGGAAPRWYHATHAVPSLFALREALAMLVTEGLPQAWGRHAAAARQLAVGLEALGLSLYVAEPGHRLPTVTTIVVPDGVAWADVTARMMKVHGVEARPQRSRGDVGAAAATTHTADAACADVRRAGPNRGPGVARRADGPQRPPRHCGAAAARARGGARARRLAQAGGAAGGCGWGGGGARGALSKSHSTLPAG